PVFAPERAHITAVVHAEPGNFAVDLPIEPHKWVINSEKIKLVPRDGYPSPQTKQGGVLLVRAKHYISTDRFQRFLAECGVPQDEHHHSQLIRTPVFQESQAVTAMRYHPDAKYVLEAVAYVPVGE